MIYGVFAPSPRHRAYDLSTFGSHNLGYRCQNGANEICTCSCHRPQLQHYPTLFDNAQFQAQKMTFRGPKCSESQINPFKKNFIISFDILKIIFIFFHYFRVLGVYKPFYDIFEIYWMIPKFSYFVYSLFWELKPYDSLLRHDNSPNV